MKILFLVIEEQKLILDDFYDEMITQAESCDVRRLSKPEQQNLKKYFNDNVDPSQYGRVVMLLRFKYLLKQVKFLQTVTNLVFLEHDACQNYIPSSKYFGKFLGFYQQIPWLRVFVSSYNLAQKFQGEGVDAHFLSKAYDDKALQNLNKTRDIELGFIGGLKSQVYNQRKEFLEKIQLDLGLELLTTAPGEDYMLTMNRIRFFISADIGLGEYMIKNFEAMACGCILATYSQGEEENCALGFEDMKTVVLYSTQEELQRKLAVLQKDEGLANSVAHAGQELVKNFTWAKVAEQLIASLLQPLRKPVIEKSYFGLKTELGYTE